MGNHLLVGIPFTMAIVLAFYGLANLRQFKYKPIATKVEAGEWEERGLKRRTVKTLEEELKLFATAMQPPPDDYEMVSTRKTAK